MVITNAKYFKPYGEENILIDATIDGIAMGVPLDPNNRHYQAILEWVAEGNTIQEAD